MCRGLPNLKQPFESGRGDPSCVGDAVFWVPFRDRDDWAVNDNEANKITSTFYEHLVDE